MDIGRLIRIRNTAREALAATPADHSSSWRGLVEVYTELRTQVASVVGPNYDDELAGYPTAIDIRTAGNSITSNPEVLFVQQDVASSTRTHLGALAGWLDGIVEEAGRVERLEAEAQAYARERVRAEGKNS